MGCLLGYSVDRSDWTLPGDSLAENEPTSRESPTSKSLPRARVRSYGSASGDEPGYAMPKRHVHRPMAYADVAALLLQRPSQHRQCFLHLLYDLMPNHPRPSFPPLRPYHTRPPPCAYAP